MPRFKVEGEHHLTGKKQTLIFDVDNEPEATKRGWDEGLIVKKTTLIQDEPHGVKDGRNSKVIINKKILFIASVFVVIVFLVVGLKVYRSSKVDRFVSAPFTFQGLNEDTSIQAEKAAPPLLLYYISPLSKLAKVPGCDCEKQCAVFESIHEKHDYRLLNVKRDNLKNIAQLFYKHQEKGNTVDREKHFLQKECHSSDYFVKIYFIKDTGKIFSIQVIFRSLNSSQILKMLREQYGEENYEQLGSLHWYGEHNALGCNPFMKEIQIFYLKNYSDWVEGKNNVDKALPARGDRVWDAMEHKFEECVEKSGDTEQCIKKFIDEGLEEDRKGQRKEALEQEKAFRKRMCQRLLMQAQYYRKELMEAKTDSERLRLRQKIDEFERCRTAE